MSKEKELGDTAQSAANQKFFQMSFLLAQMQGRTSKLKLVISLHAMVSHINSMFLKKLKLMVNVNTQLVKMEGTMIFSALSMKILPAIRLHGVRKKTTFS